MSLDRLPAISRVLSPAYDGPMPSTLTRSVGGYDRGSVLGDVPAY
jgi:hypothetical protein